MFKGIIEEAYATVLDRILNQVEKDIEKAKCAGDKAKVEALTYCVYPLTAACFDGLRYGHTYPNETFNLFDGMREYIGRLVTRGWEDAGIEQYNNQMLKTIKHYYKKLYTELKKAQKGE